MRRESRGLTLIEVLIIIVMIGILLTITIQKIRGRSTKDVIASLKEDIESVRTAESKYFAQHSAYGTRAQLDSASVLTPSTGNTWTITVTAGGYTIAAKNDAGAAAPQSCKLEVTGGEAAAANAQTVCDP